MTRMEQILLCLGLLKGYLGAAPPSVSSEAMMAATTILCSLRHCFLLLADLPSSTGLRPTAGAA